MTRRYPRPVLGRPNLTVLLNTQVNGLIFEAGRCVGIDHGRHETARANREVVRYTIAFSLMRPHSRGSVRLGAWRAGEIFPAARARTSRLSYAG